MPEARFCVHMFSNVCAVIVKSPPVMTGVSSPGCRDSAYVFPASRYVVSAAGRFAAAYSTMHIASTTISTHQRMILLVFDMVIPSQNRVM